MLTGKTRGQWPFRSAGDKGNESWCKFLWCSNHVQLRLQVLFCFCSFFSFSSGKTEKSSNCHRTQPGTGGCLPTKTCPVFCKIVKFSSGSAPGHLFAGGLRIFSPTKICHFRANTNVLNKLSTYAIRKVLGKY